MDGGWNRRSRPEPEPEPEPEAEATAAWFAEEGVPPPDAQQRLRPKPDPVVSLRAATAGNDTDDARAVRSELAQLAKQADDLLHASQTGLQPVATSPADPSSPEAAAFDAKVTAGDDTVRLELAQLAKQADDLLHASQTGLQPLATTSVDPLSPAVTALGETGLGAMIATNMRELGAMLAAAGVAAGQLSPPSRRELSPSVSDDLVTMRSPALTELGMSGDEKTAGIDHEDATTTTAKVPADVGGEPPIAAVRVGEPFRVFLRKTREHGLGLHIDETGRVTAYRGQSAQLAGVPLWATLMSIGGLDLVMIDGPGKTVSIGGQEQLARQLDRLWDCVRVMDVGERVQAVFVLAANSSPPQPSQHPFQVDAHHEALRDAAMLDVHAPGDNSDRATLRATPALIGPRSARVVRALCIMADPPFADEPSGLVNASVAYGRIVFVHRGAVPFATKIRAAQRAGAVGVVVINSADEPVLVDSHVVLKSGQLETVDDGRDLQIPTVGVGRSDGAWLTSLLARPLLPCDDTASGTTDGWKQMRRRRAELRLSLRFDVRGDLGLGGFPTQHNSPSSYSRVPELEDAAAEAAAGIASERKDLHQLFEGRANDETRGRTPDQQSYADQAYEQETTPVYEGVNLTSRMSKEPAQQVVATYDLDLARLETEFDTAIFDGDYEKCDGLQVRIDLLKTKKAAADAALSGGPVPV